jgi:hypothetical protein
MITKETGGQQDMGRAATPTDQAVLLHWGLSRLDWLDMCAEQRDRYRKLMQVEE